MNLSPLYELKERLESSIIAGISLLSEDFRLARAVEQMEPLSKASPVFLKIYQGAQMLFSKDCEDKCGALLDVLALADAVLTTQAAVGVEGELEPFAAPGMESGAGPSGTEDAVSNAPYSQLAPILEALATSGSGHYSFIVEAHDRNPEIFSDYRLKGHLVDGLNAGYAELAERMEEWLSQGDASLVPLLKRGFDPKGKKEMVRRVHVMEAIAGAGENRWYLSQLGQAEKEVRAALLLALRHSKENRDALIGFTKTEKGNCKKAAFWALAKMEDGQNLDFWEVQMKKKPDACAKYLALSTGDAVSDLVADAVMEALDQLQAQVDGGDRLLSAKDYGKLASLFSAMAGKATAKMLGVYRRLASEDLLEQMELEKKQPVQFLGNCALEKNSRMPVSHYIAEVLAESVLWCMDSRLLGLAEELYEAHGALFLKPALIAALLTKPKEAVYDTFGVQLAKEGSLNKETNHQAQVRLEIMGVFSWVIWDKGQQGYQACWHYVDESTGKRADVCRSIPEGLDIRWFAAFTDPKLKKDGTFHVEKFQQFQNYSGYYADWDQVMANLINPQDPEICGILGKYFYGRAYTAARDVRYYPLMRICGYSQAQGLVVRSLQKGRNSFWNLEYMMEEIPLSTEDKLKELDQVKKLVEDKKIAMTGWSEEKFQEMYMRIGKG